MSKQADSIEIMDVGDLGLRGSLGADEIIYRQDVQNADAFTRNIFPGDVAYAEEQSRKFKFFWHREASVRSSSNEEEFLEDELDDLEEQGYIKVTAKDDNHPDGEFIVRRWNRSAEGYVRSGRYILFAQSEERHEQQRLKRLTQLGAELDSHTDGFHSKAEELGLGSWEVRGGRSRERAKAKSRSSILDE